MHYHVMIWPGSPQQQQLGELYATNLTEEQLRERFIHPYAEGESITWAGRTLAGGDVAYMKVAASHNPARVQRFHEYDIFSQAEDHANATIRDVTNEWITGPPGQRLGLQSAATASNSHAVRDRRRVMVVYGRDLAARKAIFAFLRALGLSPIEWEQAVAETGRGSPHNLEAVTAAMNVAQAVVVILTAEDQGGLRHELAADGEEDDTLLRGQPRQNVILEAGLAMGLDADRTILVELGRIRPASDFDGLNTVRLTNDVKVRSTLRSRLETAGCATESHGQDWLDPATRGDFQRCVVEWTEQTPPQLLEQAPLLAKDDHTSEGQREHDGRIVRSSSVGRSRKYRVVAGLGLRWVLERRRCRAVPETPAP